MHAAELLVTVAEQKVARFSGVDGGAWIVTAGSTFPSVRVTREQHRVAFGAGPIDVLRVTGFAAVRGRDAQKITAQRKRGAHLARVSRVLPRATMTRLAANAELVQVLLAEGVARPVDADRERPLQVIIGHVSRIAEVRQF